MDLIQWCIDHYDEERMLLKTDLKSLRKIKKILDRFSPEEVAKDLREKILNI